jgi:hypothetical protein
MRVPVQGVYVDGAGNIVVGGNAKFYEYNTSDPSNPTTIATIYAARTGGSAIATGIVQTDTNGMYTAWVEDVDYSGNDLLTIVLSKSTHTEVPQIIVVPGLTIPSTNALINSDFNIWQRGTSFAAIASLAYSADRFIYSKVGAMVHTVSRSTDVPTIAESEHLSKYSILIDCTTVDSSLAAGDYCTISQKIEGYNYLPLAQRPMTLSFWHKHTKTGTYCVALNNSGSDRSYVAEYTQTTTNTWEKATINILASPSAGTWDYINGVGLVVRWTLASGTTFHGIADTWESENDLATSSQVNACLSTSNNFRLAQVELVAGNVATKFEHRQIAVEEASCKRYYEELNHGGAASYVFGTGQCETTTTTDIVIPYEVEKRTIPTITISAAADFRVTKAAGAAEEVTVFSISGETSVGTAIGNITVSANLAAGNATRLQDDSGGNAKIKIKAEL